MDLVITSEDFESVLSFCGTMSKRAFEKMNDSIEMTYKHIEDELLSEDIGKEIQLRKGADWTKTYLRRLIILTTMTDSLRSHDLVMTDTGFGVVSNTNIAPASAARVNELEKELKWHRDMTKSTLIIYLREVDGWGATDQAKTIIRTLMYTPTQLEIYTGMHKYKDSGTSTSQYFGVGSSVNDSGYHRATFEDLISNNREIFAADAMLRRHISDAMMEELLAAERTNTYKSDKIKRLIGMSRKYIGSIISGSDHANSKNIFYADVINYIEGDANVFKTYFDSDAYKLNHYEGYQNKEDDPGYFFC